MENHHLIDRDKMSQWLRRALTAIAFLTRIPVNPSVPFNGNDVARSSAFFPLVGALIATLQIVLLWILSLIGMPHTLQALLATVMLILLCGALHQDGLADMADGFGGGYTRDDVLRIMRDSTIGTYGGLALILSIGLRVSALVLLISHAGGWRWIIAAAVLSRCSICLAWWLPYARTTGTGASITQLTGRFEVAFASATAVVLSLVILGLHIVPAAAVCIFSFLSMAWISYRKIGGVTGDTLGATTEVSEVLLLVTGATLVAGVAAVPVA